MKRPKDPKPVEPLSPRGLLAGTAASLLAPMGFGVVDLYTDPAPALEPPRNTLAIQPKPLLTLDLADPDGGKVQTRVWLVGTAARCNRCASEECSALRVAGLVEICMVRFRVQEGGRL